MKKILLIAGIISFTAASAQQNDFFDIQKYLEKKNNNKLNPLKQKPLQTFPVLPRSSVTNFSPLSSATLSHTLPDGSKVYLLPLDNMFCIVPDMNQFNMPTGNYPHNYFDNSPERRNLPGRIPNSITPWKIIPDSNK